MRGKTAIVLRPCLLVLTAAVQRYPVQRNGASVEVLRLCRSPAGWETARLGLVRNGLTGDRSLIEDQWYNREMDRSGRLAAARVAAALLAPVAVVVAMVPFRDELEDTDAALIAVLVIVAMATTGRRTIGLLASLSAGVSFDLFLVPPYQHLNIDSQADLVTALLLLGTGVAVTELAVWGRRQQARASSGEGYVHGIHAAAESVAAGRSPFALIDDVCAELTRMFQLRRCTFDHGCTVMGGGRPRLRHDGDLEWHGAVWEDHRGGFPQGEEIELMVESPYGYRGQFLLTATDLTHSTRAQRLVAVALADQVGASLRGRSAH